MTNKEYSQKDLLAVYELFYKNVDNLFMDRKKNKFDDFCASIKKQQ